MRMASAVRIFLLYMEENDGKQNINQMFTVAKEETMKKTAKQLISAALILVMLFTFCSCGAKNKLAETKWVDAFTGSTLVFAKDGTLTYDEYTGTWTQDDTGITLTYKAGENEMIRYADLVEKDDEMYIQTRKESKCNGETTNIHQREFYPEERVDEVKKSLTKKTGETVSTDIMEFTVKEAALGYYAIAPEALVGTGEIMNLSEACKALKEESSYCYFTSSKGHCLLSVDFVFKNVDRDTCSLGGYTVDLSVVKDGKHSIVRGYDLNDKDGSYGIKLASCMKSNDGKTFYRIDTDNILVGAGETVEVRNVGVVGFEPDSLDGPFDIIVTLRDSKDQEKDFLYTIKG